MPNKRLSCLIIVGLCRIWETAPVKADPLGRNPSAQSASDVGPLKVTIDPQNAAGVISPLLFGHNLEHTRHAVWQGLSAQMIANRKFAGPAGPSGLAAHWSGIGVEGVEFAVDGKERFAGQHSQRVSISKPKISGGIVQDGIRLKLGTTYEARMWVKSDHASTVRMRLCDALDQKVYVAQLASTPLGDWREHTIVFTAPATDESARFEVTADEPCTFWIGAASLMPADHFHGMRRDVVDVLRQMSVPLFRWPGGNFTRDYRWEQGLSPVDRRPPIRAGAPSTLPFTDGYDFHEIGTDEFLALCKELSAEPSITINIADAPPEEAAGWVQYCNGAAETRWGKVRIDRGHPEPFHVKYWSIGNEIYADWMGPAHTDAATYARRIEQYAKAMKDADPSIVLIASGAAGAPVAEEGWDQKVVSGAGRHFDHIAEHHYAKTKGDAPEELARLAKIPTMELLAKWREARRTINAASQGGKRIGIAFDEWNIWHPWFAAPYQNEWHIGSRDGIYVASLLNMLCREADTLNISMAALFQPVSEGAIAVTPFSAKLTPIGQVFALYQAHHGNRLLKLPDQTGDADVDVCASLRKDGGIAATIVNRNPTAARKVEFALPAALARSEVRITLLAADGLEPDAGMTRHVMPVRAGDNHRLSLTLSPFSVVLWETGQKN
jgi:alpha-L-arabinofuranosidase